MGTFHFINRGRFLFLLLLTVACLPVCTPARADVEKWQYDFCGQDLKTTRFGLSERDLSIMPADEILKKADTRIKSGSGLKDSCFLSGAQAGNPVAMLLLAFSYDLGFAFPEKNPSSAETWYKKSAMSGLPRGMNAYGSFIEQKRESMSGSHSGKESEYVEAREWYRRAALAGNGFGQYNYGRFLRYGNGGASLPDEGKKWLQKAANQGVHLAIEELKPPKWASNPSSPPVAAVKPPQPSSGAAATQYHKRKNFYPLDWFTSTGGPANLILYTQMNAGGNGAVIWVTSSQNFLDGLTDWSDSSQKARFLSFLQTDRTNCAFNYVYSYEYKEGWLAPTQRWVYAPASCHSAKGPYQVFYGLRFDRTANDPKIFVSCYSESAASAKIKVGDKDFTLTYACTDRFAFNAMFSAYWKVAAPAAPPLLPKHLAATVTMSRSAPCDTIQMGR